MISRLSRTIALFLTIASFCQAGQIQKEPSKEKKELNIVVQKIKENFFDAIKKGNKEIAILLLTIKNDIIYTINDTTEEIMGGYSPLSYVINEYLGTRASEIYDNSKRKEFALKMISSILEQEKEINKKLFQQGKVLKNICNNDGIKLKEDELIQYSPYLSIVTIYETLINRHITDVSNERFKNNDEKDNALQYTRTLIDLILAHLAEQIGMYQDRFPNGESILHEIVNSLNKSGNDLFNYYVGLHKGTLSAEDEAKISEKVFFVMPKIEFKVQAPKAPKRLAAPV